MKTLLMVKFCVAIKKILDVLDVNLMDYLLSENILMREYAKIKLVELRKNNTMLEKYLKNKNNLKSVMPGLISNLSLELEKRDKYEVDFKETFKVESKTEGVYESENLKN